MDVFFSTVLPLIFSKLTGYELIIVSSIVSVCFVLFRIFQKKLPFIITTRKTLDFIKTSTRNTDKDILDINSVYGVQLEGIIVSGLDEIANKISKFIQDSIIQPIKDPIVIRKKTKALSISLKIILFETRDCIRQLTRENGFLEYSTIDQLKQYTKSKEFLLYGIIKNIFETDYIYNEEDNLSSISEDGTREATELKQSISESYFNLFKNIQEHLLRCRDKTNVLMDNNEKLIRDFI